MKEEVAILAGGCFWCIDAAYRQVPGVIETVSGYTGGPLENPNYGQVCSGTTGHAEAVRIRFDSEIVSFRQILDLFWKIHDPTTLNGQGADIGTQYRSAIYYADARQKAEAEASIAFQAGRWSAPLVTELVPAGVFWPAETYHQDYFRRNPTQGYCAAVIAPKLRKAGFPASA